MMKCNPAAFALSAAFLALLSCQGADGFIRLSGSGPSDAADVQQKPRLSRRIAPGFVMEEGHVRPDPKHTRETFDPEVAVHEADADLEYMGYDEDYEHNFSEEDNEEFWGGFNVTERIVEIFPKLDADSDGILLLSELHDWHHSNGRAASLRRAERSFNHSDMDGDGKITLKEYLSDHFHKYLDMPEPPKEEEEHKEEHEGEHDDTYDNDSLDVRDWHYAHEIKDRFNFVDIDGDGGLTLEEFYHFLHPEESDNAALHHHVVKHELRENDQDNDGKISLDEFQEGLWYMFHGTDEWDDEEVWSQERDAEHAKDKFQDIDGDNDGFILVVELVPHYRSMFRDEKHYAGLQAQDVIQEADSNQDQRLTLEEMLQNPEVFYSLVDDRFDHHHDYYSDFYHDEF